MKTIFVASLAYIVIGLVTAGLAASASGPTSTTGWRLAGWGLSVMIFVANVVAVRSQSRHSRPVAALRVATAVALAAFLLAVLGPMRRHWGEPGLVRLATLSLVLWPVLTGLPAFMGALVLGYLIDRRRPDAEAPRVT